MSMSFSVKVVNSGGDGVEGIRVYADFGLLHGGLTEYTGSDGWAEFEASGNYVTVELYLDGESQGDHGLSDGDTFSFSL